MNRDTLDDRGSAHRQEGDGLGAGQETGTTRSPRPDKKRLTVEDLIPGQDDVARLDQPFGTTAPGVTEEEDVSLNTTEFKYYAYFAHIKRQIELAWNYPHEAQERHEAGRLTIVFTIESGGNVSSVKLIKSSGYEILDEYAHQRGEDMPPRSTPSPLQSARNGSGSRQTSNMSCRCSASADYLTIKIRCRFSQNSV